MKGEPDMAHTSPSLESRSLDRCRWWVIACRMRECDALPEFSALTGSLVW